MPVAVAAIPAVAGLVGSAIAAHQQGKANKASAAANADALAYEKQKDVEAKARYDEAKQRYDFAQQQATPLPEPGMAPPMAPGGPQELPPSAAPSGPTMGQDPTDWADWRRYAAVS